MVTLGALRPHPLGANLRPHPGQGEEHGETIA